MTQIIAHIISHTHWDREWFLTSVYTTPWIAGLIDRLQALVDRNPAFQFYFDGQTLVIEDLLATYPNYRETIKRLVRKGNLSIGPYYCQPDWRLTSGEGLIRNLLFGRRDMEQFGAGTETGWLVDTFGHISQAPQLHQMFGIRFVYVWRGVPMLDPYFSWRGNDGSELFVINLFAGYRNLYGVTHAPKLAVRRLRKEVEKLEPFYPTSDIPLFDGYDLEDNPEDPVHFFQALEEEIPEGIQIVNATPQSFARQVQRTKTEFPVIKGELLSGKYAAVFPGTLSTRDYLKVMARDCEHLLYRVCEPLGAMAAMMGRSYPETKYENWSRGLLQNAVHDCICGVSIDQVHEKMEYNSWVIFNAMLEDINESLVYILQDFAPGDYAISTNPIPVEGWHVIRDRLCYIRMNGVGVWKIEEGIPIQRMQQPIEGFVWKNRHYEARIGGDGSVRVGRATLGILMVHEDTGDAYSEEIGKNLGFLQPTGPLVIEQRSDSHCVLGLELTASWGDCYISAHLHMIFDPSPLIRWRIDLDSRGTGFRVDIVFETGHPGQVYAGMPFDLVLRPVEDLDLLPRQLDGQLAAVLLGQRELGSTRTFPFQELIARSNLSRSALVLAKGLNAYQADSNGWITVLLRRAIEWLAKPDLESRVGDAGPSFYVPDARCERSVTHELAFAFVHGGIDDPQVQALNAGFQNPPLLLESQSNGMRQGWQFFQESLPLSSMHIQKENVIVRVHNPFTHSHQLEKPYLTAGVFGDMQETIQQLPPKKISNLVLGKLPSGKTKPKEIAKFRLFNAPFWRVGTNRSRPDPEILRQLQEKIDQLKHWLEERAPDKPRFEDSDHYLRQHQIYVLERELLEYRLSARLNEIKLARQGEPGFEDLYFPDEEVADLGRRLNQMRIQRRIYDYIVQVS